MSVDEMIALFSVDGLLKKAAIFDPKKLEWMNGQHLSRTPAEELERVVTPALVAAGLALPAELNIDRAWYLALIDLLKVRARTVDDIVRQAAPYFRDEIEYDPDAVAKQWKDSAVACELLGLTRERLAALDRWEAGPLEVALRTLADERGIAAGKIFQPLRVALTGMSVSPGIFDVLVMLGRQRSLARLDAAERFLCPSDTR
jgi:glutamyl-tRNA synthetase